jgi:hypothetical protein
MTHRIWDYLDAVAGNGLGLAIVKFIVKQHGEQIKVAKPRSLLYILHDIDAQEILGNCTLVGRLENR